jgi:hypothetical protein
MAPSSPTTGTALILRFNNSRAISSTRGRGVTVITLVVMTFLARIFLSPMQSPVAGPAVTRTRETMAGRYRRFYPLADAFIAGQCRMLHVNRDFPGEPSRLPTTVAQMADDGEFGPDLIRYKTISRLHRADLAFENLCLRATRC